MAHSQNSAFVILINDRFFYQFGKNKRIQTAWCLAGSKLYSCKNEALLDLYFIKEKYPKSTIKTITF